jgi:hypothetical protein
MCRKLTCLLLVACTYIRAEAKVWHVSKEELTGIDPSNQVRSIGEAVVRTQPGDTVIIHGGVYREKLVIDKSGSAEKPITLRAATGAHVVVTGADRITRWDRTDDKNQIFRTDWPYRFGRKSKHYAHPGDDYHRLIGRCEQVFVDGYPLRQVLQHQHLSRGTFYVDLDAPKLYVWHVNNRDITGDKAMVEAATRSEIWLCTGQYIHTKGIRFRYAANQAQHGATVFRGDHNVIESCVFEYTNSSGAEFTGDGMVVRDCIFQRNGQLGFCVKRAHHLLMTGCIVTNNNTKLFDRGWEAGGNKMVVTRGAVIENSIFTQNRGDGIWFDIGNEDNEVRNCLLAYNQNAGLYYEISYGLHAHDNVVIGNGFGFSPSDWGSSGGISLSSSPHCIIERNLLIGNKEGFNLREQLRTTPRIDGGSEPVWNHDQTLHNNVLAYNRDAQVWGWFDVQDQRHWPRSMQNHSIDKPSQSLSDQPKPDSSRRKTEHPVGLALENLELTFENNLYCPAPGQELFNWGVTWKRHKRFQELAQVRDQLRLEGGSKLVELSFKNFSGLDLRVPTESPVIKLNCYPRGNVPGVRLGTYK